jgi:hypothetical protein
MDTIFTPRRCIMSGQPQLGTLTNAIGIDCTKLEVLDPGGASNLIVEVNKDFQVQTHFEFGGLFANYLVSLPIPYKVIYYYESFGGGPEGVLAEKEGKTIAGQLVYEAETAATAKLSRPGTYKLTVVVHFEGAPMTAFTEGPLIQVF